MKVAQYAAICVISSKAFQMEQVNAIPATTSSTIELPIGKRGYGHFSLLKGRFKNPPKGEMSNPLLGKGSTGSSEVPLPKEEGNFKPWQEITKTKEKEPKKIKAASEPNKMPRTE